MIGQTQIRDELSSSKADCRRVTKHLHHFQGQSSRRSPRPDEVLQSRRRKNDCVYVAQRKFHVCRSSQQRADWNV